MITIKSHASSSSGNLYTLTSGNAVLLIECGLPLKKIQQALNFKLSSVEGCILTHEHMDHAKAALDIMSRGVDVYSSAGTFKALGISNHRAKRVEPLRWFQVGAFHVLPFPTQHDAAQPYGYLITDGEDKIVFATDTYYMEHRFTGATKIMIECNYAADLLPDDCPHAERIKRSHFELDRCKRWLKSCDLSKVTEIHLLHLSGGHSDEQRFINEIQAATGKPVYVCAE
ncbi:MAG: MBL fold metallo-hydrolase [Deltaproteobacteria bacterium]|nr:MBL fold metallo-hydrolase [Deltaproteobacteria bacterium]